MDLLFENLGTIVLLSGSTKRGRRWIARNVAAELSIGGKTAVEPRYAPDILEGAQRAGLTTHIDQ